MARKKAKEPELIALSELDAVMDGVLFQQAFEHGSRKIDADFKNHTLVIPFPAFCLEWFFGINGCPLSRSWGLASEPHVGKTAFIYEMINWHRVLGGRGAVACTEGDKDSPVLRKSITKYDPKAFEFRPCGVVEDWQEYLTKAAKRVINLFDSNPIYTVPVCWAVDSYVGALCRSKTENILKKGYAEAGYATEAKLIGEWLRVFTNHLLAGQPFTLIGATHMYTDQKQGFNPTGATKNVFSGGQKLAYMSAINIFMSHVRKHSTNEVKGQVVKFALPKNTLAGTKNFRSIECGFYWMDGDSNTPQVSWWDWDEATIWLLADRERFPAGGDIGKKLLPVCNIHTSTGNKYWSKELGVPSSEAMPASDLGKLIHTKPAILEGLRDVFNIYRHPFFEPRVKYQPVAAPSDIVPASGLVIPDDQEQDEDD